MSMSGLIKNLTNKIEKREFLVAAGVDNLEDEKKCTQAGSDFILLYPTSRYLNAVNRFLAGFIALGNTNQMMIKTADNLMPFLKSRELFAGINATDPFIIDSILLKTIKSYRFAGVHNYPTMALIDGEFGANINASGFGFEKELIFFEKAKAEGLFTCAMVRNMKQAMQMAKMNVDIIIFYLGFGERAYSGQKDSSSRTKKDVDSLKRLTAAVRKVNQDTILLFHSERVSDVEEIRVIAREVPDIDGYYVLCLGDKGLFEKNLDMVISNIKTIRSGDL
ncbi:MAG: phosphoenolpyruvate hydrolase family protein [Eubacterium sp.]|nr:phosphoenolpyruvate hydrolase family protein [Eubacterium sp.]